MAFKIKQNDTRPIYISQLVDHYGLPEQAPIDLTTATAVRFIMGNGGVEDPVAEGDCTIEDPDAGIVSYEWAVGDTDTVGTFKVEFEITWADGGIETVPNEGYKEVTIGDDLG